MDCTIGVVFEDLFHLPFKRFLVVPVLPLSTLITEHLDAAARGFKLVVGIADLGLEPELHSLHTFAFDELGTEAVNFHRDGGTLFAIPTEKDSVKHGTVDLRDPRGRFAV